MNKENIITVARYKKSQIIIIAIVFGAIAIILIGALVSWVGVSLRLGRHANMREQAFQVAEAGIDYYRWHLAHAPQDYTDGSTSSGPYIHPFYDKDGTLVGQFSLSITPPATGSTLVVIRSEGNLSADPTISRTVEARLAIPSWAKFAAVSNSDLRFGAGTEVFGPIHSNGGIRFDGLAHNIVSSARATYDDPDHSGGNEFGVHTHVSPTDPLPPASVPNRSDVFLAGRQFPVPIIDFTGLTANLSQIKTNAQASGLYFANSGALGYHIVLKTNDTFDLYRVNTLVTPPSGCNNLQNQTGWGTWSVQGETLLGNYAFPNNGLIFVEDHLWVDGQINTARLTIASGRFPINPATYTHIIVNSDLLYTNYDGQDSIGLIAQGDFHTGMVSDDNLRIDAALVAQNGRVGRYYYRPPSSGSRCSPYHVRQVLTLYGMIASNQRYGFAYTDGNGYQTRNIVYDANLLYGPPPSFPLTTDQYSVVSWEEIE